MASDVARRVYFDHKTDRFRVATTDGGHSLPGLHRRIAQTFGNNVDIHRAAVRVACHKQRRPSPPSRKACPGGQKHGSRVDTELALWTRLPAAERRRIFARRAPDVCTVRIMDELARRRWLPVAAQVPLFSEKMHVATAADLLCVDQSLPVRERRLIVVEIKCSMRTDTLHHRVGTLARVRGKVADTLVNRSALQAALTGVLVQTTLHLPVGGRGGAPGIARPCRRGATPGLADGPCRCGSREGARGDGAETFPIYTRPVARDREMKRVLVCITCAVLLAGAAAFDAIAREFDLTCATKTARCETIFETPLAFIQAADCAAV